MSKRKCADCDSEIEPDEGYWAEGRKRDVCQSCYDDIVSTCQLCGDPDVMPSQVSEFILVKDELAATATRVPGIYRILSRPFLSIPLIGSGSMGGSDVLFIDKLPKWDTHYDISGHICLKCSKPYLEKCRDVYRAGPKELLQLRRLSGPRNLWFAEREHTRRTILANPEMLRDLECDNEEGPYSTAYKWKKLRDQYQQPDHLPTFHEWLAFEWRGVKVFSTCEDRRVDSWLALKPDPKYRKARGYPEVVFAASGLPTFRFESDSPYDWRNPSASREALLMAIEQGILRQDGIFQDGKRIYCG